MLRPHAVFPNDADQNPLRTDDPLAWERLVEAVGPASMLAALQARMSPQQCRIVSPEDLWQETLLLAFEHRAQCEWRGLTSFRRWLLKLAENRLCGLLEQNSAQKRGGGRLPASLDDSAWSASASPAARGPTPSRHAVDRELAAQMAATLATLPDELREVVRLRLFEGLLLEEVAARLGIGEPAARHRFHRGIAL